VGSVNGGVNVGQCGGAKVGQLVGEGVEVFKGEGPLERGGKRLFTPGSRYWGISVLKAGFVYGGFA
jgi:hypothetical protein